ncbi:MAG: DUF1819 family protein [Gammaproteobacteria bacterium]|nr:DUF1819 family protein [Gammaproteobacteria bacterium]
MGNQYKIGFARPALLRETVLVAQAFERHRDWNLVNAQIKRDNPLQTRTARSSEIMAAEILKRLSLLNDLQIEVLAEDHYPDVNQLVWIALCKQYPFIADFTIEVLVPAHLSGRQKIDHDDYGYFFNSKADWHPELEAVSDKTRSNARQALFQMMRQCDLLNGTNQLIPQMISSAVQNCSPETDLAFIPGAIRL